MTALAEIVRYANEFLRLAECDDWPNALNGLQIENSGRIEKIGAAVDASTRSLQAAGERGIGLLLVHHGLFWPGLQPVTAVLYRQLRLALAHDVALYSAHLPLDLHKEAGNNAQLAAQLGIETTAPFLEMKGQLVGLKAGVSLARGDLIRRLEQSLGATARSFLFGPAQIRSLGIVTGGAGSEIYRVAEAGVDTFITGEAPHWAAVAAEELGINLLLGGHYATETLGVKALAAHLAGRFQIPWEFLDHPTGL